MCILIYLKDPLCFKESILVSLEVFSDNRNTQLKEWAKSIPNTISRKNFEIPKEIEESLKACLNEFKKTKTYFWLREDFKNSLYDIETQIKSIS